MNEQGKNERRGKTLTNNIPLEAQENDLDFIEKNTNSAVAALAYW